ncbi:MULTISPECIES: YgiT-type zinc finger protein [unclassified Microcoleus]|uniref:YgiT-type zinc finger protein n=1 Tax=unclassified Microcoleus TaxID=2642155 RepID=UPI002FCFC5D1
MSVMAIGGMALFLSWLMFGWFRHWLTILAFMLIYRYDIWKETMVEQKVTYTLEINGKFIIIENVPARVCVETGDHFFSPETVEELQKMILEERKPIRVIETPVFEFA